MLIPRDLPACYPDIGWGGYRGGLPGSERVSAFMAEYGLLGVRMSEAGEGNAGGRGYAVS